MRFLADNDFDGRVVQGLLQRLPLLDLVRVQDIDMGAADDPSILARAADEGRLVLTHDRQTLIGFANQRVAAGLPMPGVVVAPNNGPVGRAIDDLEFLAGAGEPEDFDGQVRYLPLV